jgi:Leucine-rich repeat (LRR) protein
MRKIAFVFCLLLTLGSFVAAQEATPSEIALERIEAALQNGTTRLNLSGLGLTELPPEIGQLTELQTLDLSNNELQSLPAEIGQLRNLRQLELQNNQLNELPPQIGQLNNLQALFLGTNELEVFPDELWGLRNLLQLHLQDNSIYYPPMEIGRMPKLERLELGGNPLSDINLTLAERPYLILGYLQHEWQKRQRLIYGVSLAVVIVLVVIGLAVNLRWRKQRAIKEADLSVSSDGR